jgi:hypothetical protein
VLQTVASIGVALSENGQTYVNKSLIKTGFSSVQLNENLIHKVTYNFMLEVLQKVLQSTFAEQITSFSFIRFASAISRTFTISLGPCFNCLAIYLVLNAKNPCAQRFILMLCGLESCGDFFFFAASD